MDRHLHIVCFDVPYPPDYGGVIDVFYKIKALHAEGVKIYLHCFEYGRGQQIELNKYCEEVNYYKRINELPGFTKRLPYIVKSRANPKLLKNLLKDDHPILLEGIHCTYYLFAGKLKNKKVAVRLHNVEYQYYHQLEKNENSFLKKLYFKTESKLLKIYEKKIAGNAAIFPISENDAEVYRREFGANNIQYLPAFTPFNIVSSKDGKGVYCLFHGNLSVNENEKATIFLAEKIFYSLPITLIIAGKNPTKKLKKIVSQYKNISLIENASEEEMNNLISNAQINILPFFNSAGIKIKLLYALFCGRHCLVNTTAVAGTRLEQLCEIAKTEDEFREKISQLFEQPFSITEINKRKKILEAEYNNSANAKQLMQWIY